MDYRKLLPWPDQSASVASVATVARVHDGNMGNKTLYQESTYSASATYITESVATLATVATVGRRCAVCDAELGEIRNALWTGGDVCPTGSCLQQALYGADDNMETPHAVWAYAERLSREQP